MADLFVVTILFVAVENSAPISPESFMQYLDVEIRTLPYPATNSSESITRCLVTLSNLHNVIIEAYANLRKKCFYVGKHIYIISLSR